MKWTDPIVEEVRRIKEEIAARNNYDVHAIVAEANAFYERWKREREASADAPSGSTTDLQESNNDSKVA